MSPLSATAPAPASTTLRMPRPPARPQPEMSSGAAASSANAAAPVPSEQLLQGRKTIEISHNGSVYRLQSTKLGKLILTK